MIIETAISLFIGGTFYTIDQIQASTREKRGILNALDESIRLTEYHVATSRTEDDQLIPQTELYQAWNRLADTIRPYDNDLADTFKYKSELWLNPNTWADQIEPTEEERLRMSLSQLRTDYWRLKTIWNL